MAKTVLLGKDKEKQLKEQKKIAKAKNKKQRRGPIRYLKDVWNELKKVTWPGKKELLMATLAVIAFILVMAIIIGVFDYGLGQLINLILK